ncbi:WYL domain-containing protein [Tessaracoccus aquimaris]|uniref:helix-turn-helix transcriptional regulator n=1 Tax=Tessaracoccus aquimaris TaxID=1332264 RepID=UPI001313F86A
MLQRHRRATSAWLAERLDVSVRTVLRDMEALSSAGVPVYTEQGRGGGCVLLDSFTTEASGLTTGEAQALFAWAGREAAADLGLGAELTGALAKIAATAPKVAVSSAEAMADQVLADRRSWYGAREEVPALPALRRALADGRRVRIGYRSAEASESRLRTLDPIGLVDNAGRWYLVAEHRGRPRTYRVSRVTAVEQLRDPARPRSVGPVQEVWDRLRANLETATAPTPIVVTVDPAEAGRMRRLLSMQLATGAAIEERADPDGRLRWSLPIRQADVICAMAVMAAPALTLIEPAHLRAEVVDAAARALEHYGSG